MDTKRHIEKLEILDGSRGPNAMRQAAVRVADLLPLLQMPPRLKSAKAAGSTPTKAEHDALVDDLNAMHRRMMAVVEAIQDKLLP